MEIVWCCEASKGTRPPGEPASRSVSLDGLCQSCIDDKIAEIRRGYDDNGCCLTCGRRR